MENNKAAHNEIAAIFKAEPELATQYAQLRNQKVCQFCGVTLVRRPAPKGNVTSLRMIWAHPSGTADNCRGS